MYSSLIIFLIRSHGFSTNGARVSTCHILKSVRAQSVGANGTNVPAQCTRASACWYMGAWHTGTTGASARERVAHGGAGV
jgi:hypothetical protein